VECQSSDLEYGFEMFLAEEVCERLGACGVVCVVGRGALLLFGCRADPGTGTGNVLTGHVGLVDCGM
jgi:hypothetical protein